MEANQNITNVQVFEQMPSAELEQLLRLYTSEIISMNEDTVIEISSILAKRGCGKEKSQAAAASFESFKNRIVLESVRSVVDLPPPKKASRILWKSLRRFTAAVLAIFLFGGAIPAAIGADNIFTILGRWTDDLFSFYGMPNYQGDNEYNLDKLESVVKTVCRTDHVVPKWLPEGFTILSTETTSTSDCASVIAVFAKGERQIYYLCSAVFDGSQTYYEKDAPDATEYEFHGQTFYIMTNSEDLFCTWASDNVECQIWGNITEEELHQIIISIYKEESR